MGQKWKLAPKRLESGTKGLQISGNTLQYNRNKAAIMLCWSGRHLDVILGGGRGSFTPAEYEVDKI